MAPLAFQCWHDLEYEYCEVRWYTTQRLGSRDTQHSLGCTLVTTLMQLELLMGDPLTPPWRELIDDSRHWTAWYMQSGQTPWYRKHAIPPRDKKTTGAVTVAMPLSTRQCGAQQLADKAILTGKRVPGVGSLPTIGRHHFAAVSAPSKQLCLTLDLCRNQEHRRRMREASIIRQQKRHLSELEGCLEQK